MIIKVDVTVDDIFQGVPEDSRRCPYAIACRRVFGRENVTVEAHSDCRSMGRYWSVSFGAEQSSTSAPWKAYFSFDLSKACSAAVELFDRTSKMEPHSFEIEI